MHLNRGNYEAFMLDYLEGNLSPSELKAFKIFLEENPDLKTRIFQTGLFHLKPNSAYFPDKELLKKMPFSAREDIPEPDKTCIASIEKDLPEAEMILFVEKVNRDPFVQQTLKRYKRMLLKGDPVIFPGKSSLKKSVFLIPPLYMVGSLVAAGILFLFLFKFFLLPLRPYNLSTTSDASTEQPTNSGQKNIRNIEQPSILSQVKKEHKTTPIQVNSVIKRAGLTEKNSEPSKRISRSGMITPLSSPATNAHPEIFQKSISSSNLGIPILYLTERLGEEEIRAINNYHIEKFKLKILTPIQSENHYPPFWVTIANLGVKGLDKLTKWNMELKPEYNNQGDLSALAFHSKILNFSSDLGKSNQN